MNYIIIQTNQRKLTKHHKPQPNSTTKKRKPTVPNLDYHQLRTGLIILLKATFKSEHKRTKHQKVERQTQNKEFDFEKKTQLGQQKKTVIKKARKVELNRTLQKGEHEIIPSLLA